MSNGTVLAGPVQFSPAEIALIVAVLAAAALVLTAPGWLALGFAARQRATAAGAGRSGRAWAWVGGAFAGMGTSAVVAAAVNASDVGGVWAMVLASWAACGGLALVIRPQSAAGRANETASEGWGR